MLKFKSRDSMWSQLLQLKSLFVGHCQQISVEEFLHGLHPPRNLSAIHAESWKLWCCFIQQQSSEVLTNLWEWCTGHRVPSHVSGTVVEVGFHVTNRISTISTCTPLLMLPVFRSAQEVEQAAAWIIGREALTFQMP
jgi:hypothetical protein